MAKIYINTSELQRNIIPELKAAREQLNSVYNIINDTTNRNEFANGINDMLLTINGVKTALRKLNDGLVKGIASYTSFNDERISSLSKINNIKINNRNLIVKKISSTI